MKWNRTENCGVKRMAYMQEPIHATFTHIFILYVTYLYIIFMYYTHRHTHIVTCILGCDANSVSYYGAHSKRFEKGTLDAKQAASQMHPPGREDLGPGRASAGGACLRPGHPEHFSAQGQANSVGNPTVRSPGRNPEHQLSLVESRGQKVLWDKGRQKTPNRTRQSIQEWKIILSLSRKTSLILPKEILFGFEANYIQERQ